MADTLTQSGAGFVQPTGAADISTSTAIRRLVMRCDVGTTDDSQSVDDTGAQFVATIVSRPFMFAGLMNRMGVMAGAVLAKAIGAGSVLIKLLRDYEEEDVQRVVDFTPAGSEDPVIVPLDSLVLSEMNGVQVGFTDDEDDLANAVSWELHMAALKPRKEQTS